MNPRLMRFAQLLAAVAFFALHTSAFATSASDFTPSPTDVSIGVLQEILGNWHAGAENGVTPLFSGAMTTFNLAVLVFATAIFAYTALWGTLQTAHDGQLLGKQWSTVWVPVRFSLGISLLVPTASGLCMVQLGLLWLLSNGVGIASTLASASIDNYIAQMGRLVSVRMVNSDAVESVTVNVLANELCVAALNRQRPGEYGVTVLNNGSVSVPTGSFVFNANNPPAGAQIQWGQLPGTQGGRAINVCGSVTINNETAALDDLERQANYGQANGVLAVAEQLRPFAVQALDYNGDMSFVSAQSVSEAVRDAALHYQHTVGQNLASQIVAQTSQWTTQMRSAAAESGWFTLGTWYFQLGRLNGKLNDYANSIPKVVGFDTAPVSPDQATLGGFDSSDSTVIEMIIHFARQYFSDQPLPSGQLITENGMDVGGSMSSMSWIDNTTNAIFGAGGEIDVGVTSFTTNGASGFATAFGFDPSNSSPAIVQLKNVGDWMIVGVYVAAGVDLLGDKILSATPMKRAGDLFSRFLSPSASKGAGVTAMTIASFAALALLVFGIILAFWLPMLPFINWIGGLVGWVISVLEMLVAAPVWLAAHLHPDGDGMASQHAASGYKIVIELLLRPVLMVFGFIVAVIIVDPMLNIISWMYFPAFSSATADSTAGPITLTMMIIIYVVICWMCVNFAFKAITTVPAGVMSWIGGVPGDTHTNMAESMGDNTRSVVIAGAHQIQGAVRAGVSAGARRATAGASSVVQKALSR